MPLRVLQHGFAATTPSVGLEPGKWADVGLHGQFLIDLEFLLRYGPRSGTASCVVCKSPPYLLELAHQFPWIHFYVFEHSKPKTEEEEYDPAQPELVCSSPLTVQTEFNRTTSPLEFTKEMARTMGERTGRERESLLMICHGLDSIRQLALHVLMRPSHSLLDVNGVMPVDYLEGEIVLPLFLPNHKIFACLVARQQAGCKTYDPELYLGEMGAPERERYIGAHWRRDLFPNGPAGFFQGIMRVSRAYDESSKELIAGEYARSTHAFHGCSPDILKTGLLGTIDLLWATGVSG